MVAQNVIAISAIVGTFFTYCSFGQSVTLKFLSVCDAVYENIWYKYPILHQKFFILILMRSQRQFYFRGMKMYRCSLEKFTGVSEFEL